MASWLALHPVIDFISEVADSPADVHLTIAGLLGSPASPGAGREARSAGAGGVVALYNMSVDLVAGDRRCAGTRTRSSCRRTFARCEDGRAPFDDSASDGRSGVSRHRNAEPCRERLEDS